MIDISKYDVTDEDIADMLNLSPSRTKNNASNGQTGRHLKKIHPKDTEGTNPINSRPACGARIGGRTLGQKDCENCNVRRERKDE